MKAGSCWILGCVLLLVLGVSMSGCNDENMPRSRVMVTRIAGPNADEDLSTAVYSSDVLDAGEDKTPLTEDDVVYEDHIVVTVENQPSSALLALRPDGPFGSVTLTSYRVTYAVPGEEIATIDGGLHLVVPTGSSAQASLVLVTALAKTLPPLASLAASGDELMGSATITLRGYEQTSNDEVTATATIQIQFANWQDI